MKQYPVYLNGKLTTTTDKYAVVNPANGETVAEMSRVDRSVVSQAIKDGHEAFGSWRALPGKQRGDFLRNIAGEVEKRRDEIARLITQENGKPIAQSLGEVGMTIDHLTWFAEEARRGYGRIVPNQTEGKRHLVIKTPMGVVGAISPWNFPLVLAIRKVAPALAAGCTVVLKPASKTPMACSVFAECAHAAGLPPGVFQLVCGNAAEISAEFLNNPLCRKITFTGSTEVGRELIVGAAKQIKPLSLELGGHAPVVIFDDAKLEDAIESVMIAKFRNSGQSCIAANRILVQRGIYQSFLQGFVKKTQELVTGDGLDPKSHVGALIDAAALNHAEKQVADAVKLGARVLCGGKKLARPGFFFEPTVLADVPAQALCMHEETFAPIAAVAPFDTEAEAVQKANDSPYGLSAYAFTRDLGRMFRMAEALEAGIIGINDGLPTVSHAPFGGVKQSGWGRELGSEGMDAFMDVKHVSIGI
jgi:succinate-semialdehyde dehydrogenase/glutarate-semialdehyde dehydrogenase